MNWLKIYSDLPYEKAMLKARKIQREEAKLKALGGCGNYDKVDIRLSFEVNKRKLYAVWVVPNEVKAIRGQLAEAKKYA
jgi:hypothetical protein